MCEFKGRIAQDNFDCLTLIFCYLDNADTSWYIIILTYFRYTLLRVIDNAHTKFNNDLITIFQFSSTIKTSTINTHPFSGGITLLP